MNQALIYTGDVMDRAITRLLRIHTGEMSMTSIALFFGFWLVAPGNPQSSPGYVALRHLMPTEAWGVVSVLIGGAFVGARLLHSPRIFGYAAFASSVWWTFIAITYGMLNVSSTAIPVFTSMALTSMLAFLKNTVPPS